MDFIRCKTRDDFGKEFYVQFINFGRHWPRPIKSRSVLQFSVSWNDDPGWPYIQITSGNNGLFGILIWIHKFGFDLDLMSRTWNFKHLEKLNDEQP